VTRWVGSCATGSATCSSLEALAASTLTLTSSGSFGDVTVIRRASSRVSWCAAERRPRSCSKLLSRAMKQASFAELHATVHATLFLHIFRNKCVQFSGSARPRHHVIKAMRVRDAHATILKCRAAFSKRKTRPG
jgi:hypothetical protein